MRRRFKPVYKVRWRDTVYPKELFATPIHRFLDIVSPSRVWTMWYYGGDVLKQYRLAFYSRIRIRVNKRRATREEYLALRHYERASRRR